MVYRNVKQRALMLDLEYNLSQRTSSRRVSATMLAGRLLTEHRVQLAALADLTESNGNNLDELRCNVTLDGFMQKLGRLLDHSPGILVSNYRIQLYNCIVFIAYTIT
jgi:hypothetical protein